MLNQMDDEELARDEFEMFVKKSIESDSTMCGFFVDVKTGEKTIKAYFNLRRECRGVWQLVIEVGDSAGNKIYEKIFPFRFDDNRKMVSAYQ